MLDTEVRVCVRYLKKTKGMKGVNESNTKLVKLEGIAKFLGITVLPKDNKQPVRKRAAKVVPTLRDISLKTVSKYSKAQLNIISAEYNFDDEYKKWIRPVENIMIDDNPNNWFYKPEYSYARQQVEVKCIDSTHLFTRARRKSCAGGMEGLANEAWKRVAAKRSTLLTPIMVTDITDPMSVGMAKTHFSESVEAEMRKNGDSAEADLCSDIRNWWESEDKPGIPAATRLELRKALRKRLLSKVQFARFPPPTQYVCGWPLIASIDAKALVYGLLLFVHQKEKFMTQLTSLWNVRKDMIPKIVWYVRGTLPSFQNSYLQEITSLTNHRGDDYKVGEIGIILQ